MSAIQTQFTLHRQTRAHLMGFLQLLTPAQLSHVPTGFSNHIFWNIAHCVVTQQLLCYYLTENKMWIDMEWVNQYKKGTTAPTQEITPAHIEELKKLLQLTSNKLEEDYHTHKFHTYKSYLTSYGYEIDSIESAIAFNNLHEGLHLGYCMAMKKHLP